MLNNICFLIFLISANLEELKNAISFVLSWLRYVSAKRP